MGLTKYSVRPGRVPSGVGFVVGIVFILIGLFVVILSTSKVGRSTNPDMGKMFPPGTTSHVSYSKSNDPTGDYFSFFGSFWTGMAIIITLYHGYNLFSDKGSSLVNLQVSKTESTDEESENVSASDRLKELKKMKDENLINTSEYEIKRQEIINKL